MISNVRKNNKVEICQIVLNDYFCSPKIESFRLKKWKQERFPPAGVNIKIEIMYAIVEIAGQQFKVEKDKKLFVHHLELNEGDSVDFEKVLLVENDGNIAVGTPTVKGAKVTAKVLQHVKGEKVLVFKKKRRKTYQKMNGHRQQFTQIQVETIVG
jgi:large subunit ribosomal protein L21